MEMLERINLTGSVRVKSGRLFSNKKGDYVMTGLAVKDVQFNGSTLRAAQDAENIICVGVRWLCEGLGLSKGQMQNERKKIQTDEVVS